RTTPSRVAGDRHPANTRCQKSRWRPECGGSSGCGGRPRPPGQRSRRARPDVRQSAYPRTGASTRRQEARSWRELATRLTPALRRCSEWQGTSANGMPCAANDAWLERLSEHPLEVLPTGAREHDLRAAGQEQDMTAMEVRLDLVNARDVDDRRPMHTHE